MKIQNTITQPQLEMLLRLANTMHSGNPAWRYGQSVFNAIGILLPNLAEEIRGNPKIDPYNWLEDYGARWTQWYAAVCPDEPRKMESLDVGEIAYSEKEQLLFDSSAKEDEWEEHEVCAECQSISIVYKDCVCTYMKNYPTITLKFKKCSHCGHVDDTHLHESEINSEPLTKEQQEMLDFTASFTKKHK